LADDVGNWGEGQNSATQKFPAVKHPRQDRNRVADSFTCRFSPAVRSNTPKTEVEPQLAMEMLQILTLLATNANI